MKCDFKNCKQKATKTVIDKQILGEVPPEVHNYCEHHAMLAEAVNAGIQHILDNWERIMADALFFAKAIKEDKANAR